MVRLGRESWWDDSVFTDESLVKLTPAHLQRQAHAHGGADLLSQLHDSVVGLTRFTQHGFVWLAALCAEHEPVGRRARLILQGHAHDEGISQSTLLREVVEYGHV